MSLIPPPEGFHIAPRNPDGSLSGRLDPKDTERREAKRKSDMERYFARSKEAQERLVKAAKGIQDKVEAPAPKDELDFVVMNILADPAGHLDGKGSATLHTLTEDQRRARARARMDEQAADARKALDKAINPEPEETFGYALGYEGAVLPEDLDNLHDELADDDAFGVGINPHLEAE